MWAKLSFLQKSLVITLVLSFFAIVAYFTVTTAVLDERHLVEDDVLEMISNDVQKDVCIQVFSVRNELGLPDPITGVDCYQRDEKPILIYRMAHSSLSRDQSLEAWAVQKDLSQFLLLSEHGYLLVNEHTMNSINDLYDGDLHWIKYDLTAIPAVIESPELACARDIDAVIHSWVEGDTELEPLLKTKVRKLLVTDFSDMRKAVMNKQLDPLSSEFTVKAGNKAGPLNQICVKEKSIFYDNNN